MTAYTLSGSGVQALSAGTTAMYLAITTLPAGLPSGRANPTNHFDVGLVRFGDATGFFAPVPVLGGPQWIGVPVGTTRMGYAMLNGAVVTATEAIGGPTTLPLVLANATLTYMPLVVSSLSRNCIGSELAAVGASPSSNTLWGTPNLAILIPLIVTEAFAVTRGWIFIGTAAAGNWDVGVYDTSFALLGHTGSIAEAGSQVIQDAALSVTLSPGRYWLALSADAANFSFGGMAPSGSPRVRFMGVRAASADFPLANTPTLTTTSLVAVPSFGLSTYVL